MLGIQFSSLSLPPGQCLSLDSHLKGPFYKSHSSFTTLISTFTYLPSKMQNVFYTYSLHLSTVPKIQHSRESGMLQKVCGDWKDACKHKRGCLRLADSCAAKPTKQLVAGARVNSQLPHLLSAPLWMSPASTNADKKSSWSQDGKRDLSPCLTVNRIPLLSLMEPCPKTADMRQHGLQRSTNIIFSFLSAVSPSHVLTKLSAQLYN